MLRCERPGSQTVSQRWGVDWETFLASRRGFVIVHMDVSGSGFSGDKTRKSVHRRLGGLESQDVLHVIRLDNIFLDYLIGKQLLH